MINLDELSPCEQLACRIAAQTLGADVMPWDVSGRQGAVEAYLVCADGRNAAFEVTTLAADRAMQPDSLLSRDNHFWPLPGEWWWSVTIGDVGDLPRLRSCFSPVVRLCEQYGVTRPEALPWIVRQSDPDVEWLVKQSAVALMGHPDVPARDGDRQRSAQVMPALRGGAVDDALVGLHDALVESLSHTHVQRRIDKLLKHLADEHHLFVAIHASALPFPVFYGLAFGTQLPHTQPPVPHGVTGLWLTPDYSRRVLYWHSGRWNQIEPYGEF